MAAGMSQPDLAPNPSVGWFAYAREFIPPASGAGPVRQDPAHPHVSNDDFRVTGRQPTFPVGDPNNPILQPWASDKIRKRNELILPGKPVFSPHASCWPIGVLEFVLSPMTRPLYFVQGPKEVVMILTSFSDVRRVYLADKHSANVKTSWYGESIGHYEGDTLVVDTIGLDDRTLVDQFGTPHTKELHVIERYHLIDGGKTLEANVHVEDLANATYRLYSERSKYNVAGYFNSTYLASLCAGTLITMCSNDRGRLDRLQFSDEQRQRLALLRQNADELNAHYLGPAFSLPSQFGAGGILRWVMDMATLRHKSTLSVAEEQCLHPGLVALLAEPDCELLDEVSAHARYARNVAGLPGLDSEQVLQREAAALRVNLHAFVLN